MRRNETPCQIWLKFCTVAGISDIITCVYFGDDRLRGLEWRGSNFPFLHRLSSSSLQHSRTNVRVCDIKKVSYSVKGNDDGCSG